MPFVHVNTRLLPRVTAGIGTVSPKVPNLTRYPRHLVIVLNGAVDREAFRASRFTKADWNKGNDKKPEVAQQRSLSLSEGKI